ncbi:seipin-2-like isoform X1 [Cucurbita moschata]|uniref:Seipin-2-like isoform X1 n=1 Tax=Cucurbita moschata TaxID=3662 RepID=A0A6J1EEQ2_CUCMO|nr:seipin-2-like isoform X1 [Cucurbita moschata]XP_022926563.1 seipin-2-like isoform X1 [Cucurbita moschata]
MESHNTKDKDNEDDDDFFDTLDEFPSEDSSVTDQPQLSTSLSSISDSSTVPETSSENEFSSVDSLRHRPSARRRMAGETPSSDSSISSLTSTIDDSGMMSPEWKTPEIHPNFIDDVKKLEGSEALSVQVSSWGGSSSVKDEKSEVSTVTTVETNSGGELGVSEAESGHSSSNLLMLIVGLLIKAIGVQLSFFVYSFCFPLWFLYHSYTFVFHPFQTIKLGRAYVTGKLFGFCELVTAVVSPLISERLKEPKSLWKAGLRCVWGFLWSAYVCIILCGLLISALIFGGFLMRFLVQEPVKIKEVLNFDYTKHSPEAYMPILPDSDVLYGRNCKENVVSGKIQSRVIPHHHHLQAIVSLTLPESEYNRNLGVFQVRVDFLSVSGDVLASSSHPCMLQFRSEPIRLLLTILKLAPLVTGYISESQTLNLKLKGLAEGNIPTACLRVTIEQRAEFSPGAGIPEIYDASLILESELPLFKRIIWYWRKTLYVWISMTSFMMQLLFMLVCCRPIILPRMRMRRRDGSANVSSTRNDI